MKLLRVIATLDARHGGPAAGLRAITPALAALGHETTFASLDAPDAAASQCSGSPVVALGPARGGYAYSPRLSPWLREHAAEYDAVFVHGLWQYCGRAVRGALRPARPPYFVFPHGMLDPWFGRAYPLKHVKKWFYWQLCERQILRDAAAVLFTCAEERRLAHQAFRPYRCQERVVAYGTAAPTGSAADQCASWRNSIPALGDRPFWLFLGRIHPKKGVDLLLRAYGQLGAAARGELPALVLAGPSADPRYRAELEKLATALPPACRVFWPGMLEGDRKWGALRCAEVMVLPSHQENFGVVVAEALAVGTPALLSRQVNIWSELEAHGAGLADTDDLDGTMRLLRRWLALPPALRIQMGTAAADLFRRRYEINRAAHSLVDTIAPFISASASTPRHETARDSHPAYRVG